MRRWIGDLERWGSSVIGMMIVGGASCTRRRGSVEGTLDREYGCYCKGSPGYHSETRTMTRTRVYFSTQDGREEAQNSSIVTKSRY
ncbi:hypothetical protein QBC45DRAFT_415129 [Copromyces sp. CBS 386.78]|nr:hypothetical protein QBC45DRAFT_415129 [Copromyces sp. CBS 386.78]